MAPVSTIGPQATSLKRRRRNHFFAAGPRLKKRSAPRPGSATHGYRNPNTKQRHRRPSRHCSRVRWPRLSHLAPRPHPSRQWLRIRFDESGHLSKNVRRRDRVQRPTATKNPNTKPLRRRQSRHCSRVRRPRFPHLAPRPHPSRQRLRIRFFASGPMPKRRSVTRSERRSAPRPGSATHGDKRSEYETTAQATYPNPPPRIQQGPRNFYSVKVAIKCGGDLKPAVRSIRNPPSLRVNGCAACRLLGRRVAHRQRRPFTGGRQRASGEGTYRPAPA